MSQWTSEEATRELLAVLPLLNRIMIAQLRPEAHDDMTMPQFRVLALLDEQPQTLSALARKRRVSLQAGGELVQVLVERGWVTRTPDPADRRQWLLELSEVGRRQYEQAQTRMVRGLIPLIEQLTDEEMCAVQCALPALHRVLSSGQGTDEWWQAN